MIERRYDAETGIIYVYSVGPWTQAEVDEHYDHLRDLIAPIRARGEQIRLLSEIASAPWLDPSYQEHLRTQMERTFRRGDRVAVLARQKAERDQLVPFLADFDLALFFSRVPAEHWLLHDTLPPPKRR